MVDITKLKQIGPTRKADERRRLSSSVVNSASEQKRPGADTPKHRASTVHAELRARIVAGSVPPGHQLAVDDLARDFGVSRQPVMDALRQLASERFVDIVPKVGSRVANYDVQALRDFVGSTRTLHGDICALAAERRTAEQLDRIIDRTAEIPVSEWHDNQLISELYIMIVEAAHSDLLGSIAEQNWFLGDFAWSALSRSERRSQKYLEHNRWMFLQIVDAIARRDEQCARLYMQAWLCAGSTDEATSAPPD